jgi:hypothetical protein
MPYNAISPSGELIPAPQLPPPPKKDDMNGLY